MTAAWYSLETNKMSKQTSKEIIAEIIERSGILSRPKGSRVILHLSVMRLDGPHPKLDDATDNIMLSIIGSMSPDEHVLDETQGFELSSDHCSVSFGYSEVEMDDDEDKAAPGYETIHQMRKIGKKQIVCQ